MNKPAGKHHHRASERNATDAAPERLAVIDIGSSAIRLAIAETSGEGRVRMLEQLTHGVSLGRDSFRDGNIQPETLTESIRVLRLYREKLDENQLKDPRRVRVVATSAVQEASNRLFFVDRIYMSTGFSVELIENAEISRAMYLGIQPLLNTQQLRGVITVLLEVGGGKTETLVLSGANVLHSGVYRLGSLRLEQMLQSFHAPVERSQSIMIEHIRRTLAPLMKTVPETDNRALLAIGGDVRFAAHQMLGEARMRELSSLPLEDLEEFTDYVLARTADQLMQEFRLGFTEAEMLGPALLVYVQAARMMGVSDILVSQFSLRDALFHEMVNPDIWSEDFRNQVVGSAHDLAVRFRVDQRHAVHVAQLAQTLFRELKDQHGLGTRFEAILAVAALLHEVGLFISNSGFHKHSYYVILHSAIFGLSANEQRIAALVARYHRRASPKPTHDPFVRMNRRDRVTVQRLASILRIANCLDHSRSQRIEQIQCDQEKSRLIITVANPIDDLSLEQLELRQNAAAFRATYGLNVLLRRRAVDSWTT